jgi:hypothetical protein
MGRSQTHTRAPHEFGEGEPLGGVGDEEVEDLDRSAGSRGGTGHDIAFGSIDRV